MIGLIWVLIVGVAGWLTEKILGEEGYGKALGGYAVGLDIFFGIIGASFCGYLLSWPVIGEVSSSSRYATTILASIALVVAARLVSASYSPYSSR